MNEYMYLAVGVVGGGSISAILTRLFALARLRDTEHTAASMLATSEEWIAARDATIRAQGREIAEYRAAEQKRQAQRVAAAAKGRAVQEAKRAAEQAARDARHAEMRASLEVI